MSLVPSIVKFTSANYRCIIVPFPYPDSESVAIAPPMCRALIGIITMSRKKGDLLRLKKHEKRSNTIFEDTTSARIHVSTGSTDFKRIDLLNDKSRYLTAIDLGARSSIDYHHFYQIITAQNFDRRQSRVHSTSTLPGINIICLHEYATWGQ